MDRIKKIGEAILSAFSGLLSVVFVGVFCWMIGKVFLEPLAPLITVLFFLVGTMLCFVSVRTGILAVLAIILYATGWATVRAYGDIGATMICSVGILLWFASLMFSFQVAQLPSVTAVTE
jgi:hypothetical protein